MRGPVIDVHAHLAPGLPEMENLAGVSCDDDRLVIDGRPLSLAALYDAPTFAGSLASHSIDVAWVSPPPPLYRQGMSTEETSVWVTALDRGMRARVAEHAELSVLTYLPLDQPAVAEELVTTLDSTGPPAGWTASAGGGSLPLDHPDLEPLWRRLEAAGRPLLLHPGTSPDSRLNPHYLSNLLGNPVETGLAVAELLFGGVLTRHPSLKVVLVHCGGVVPAVVGRWSRGVETARPGVSASIEDPRSAVRRLWSDVLAHEPAVVDLAVSVFGPDRLVLGSDYPFAMGMRDPFEAVAHLPSGLREQIARNASALIEGV